MACRNSIIEFYKQFKNVETFADIVNLLKTEVKMPNVAGSFGNDDCSLHNQCMRLGYQFANYYVQYHAIRQGRPLATVSTNEIIAQGESWGRRLTTRLARRSTRPRSCSGSAIQAGLRSTASPRPIGSGSRTSRLFRSRKVARATA